MSAAVPFDPDAECPRWERFLREVFADYPEIVDYVHRAVGYSFTGIFSASSASMIGISRVVEATRLRGYV